MRVVQPCSSLFVGCLRSIITLFSYSDEQVTVMLAISAFTMQPDQHQRLKKVFWNGVDYVLRAIIVQLGLRMKYLALRGRTGKFTEHGEMICQSK